MFVLRLILAMLVVAVLLTALRYFLGNRTR
jgi:hypothetical protein